MEQYILQKGFIPSFAPGTQPKLSYLYKIRAERSDCMRAMHAHSSVVEVSLIMQGQSVYLINGRQYVVKAGDLMICNTGVVHEEHFGIDGQLRTFCLGVSGLHLAGMRAGALIGEKTPPVFPCGARARDVQTLFELIFQQMADRVPRAQETCHYLMLSLLSILLDLTGRHVAVENRQELKTEILAHRIRNYIDQHFAEELTLQQLSETLHVSKYYMSHVFKAVLGCSPMQYVLRRRIGEAQSLLMETDYSATQIGVMTGFGNPSYFNAIFTRTIGISPLKYRLTRNTHEDAP